MAADEGPKHDEPRDGRDGGAGPSGPGGPPRRVGEGTVLWEPPPRRVAEASVTRYREWLADEHQLRIADSTRLRLWAEAEPGRFWDSIWEFCAVEGDRGDGPALTGAAVPDARWFPTARVNYAENALTRHGPAPAIIAVREDGATAVVSWDELRRQVARAAAGLRRLGVRPGDRVGAVLPNTVHAVVAMLATASVGAVWASCSPDLEPAALAERFIQITPRVLIGVDGYTRGGQGYDAIPPLADLARRLPNLAATVLVPYLSADAYPRAASADLPGLLTWDDLLAAEAEPAFTRLPFDAPLWILFADEIAGPPRPVVHGHGGILLEHLKSLVLHLDLGPDDRFCWYGTTSGMMWNYQVSGLLTGATIVLYDGSPSHPDVSILWRLAEAVDVTCLGVSVALVEACRRVGLVPGRVADLSLLRTVGAFGAPFTPEAGAWVYDTVSPSVAFVAMSGGTEVCTALVTGLPTDPVRAGEAGRALGCAVAVVDPSGREVPGGGAGELVVTAPMPSAPLFVWGDPTGSWLLQKHLARFPGWWWQGERARMTQAGGIAVDGPLDALAAPTGARTAGA